ncbi:MAG: SGNH/GDSL hydrolase N-terminal domain-containing protein, partial [Planctomycetota bacterium]
MVKNNRISIFKYCDFLKTGVIISLLVASSFVSGCFANNADSKKADVNKPQLQWYTVDADKIEGKGFSDTKHPFDRLPARAEKLVRKKVWDLSRQSAGLLVRFETDSSQIHAKWKLLSKRLNMPHMPTTSVSGIDLYTKDKASHWRWIGAAKQIKAVKNQLALVKELDTSNRRTYLMYLP